MFPICPRLRRRRFGPAGPDPPVRVALGVCLATAWVAVASAEPAEPTPLPEIHVPRWVFAIEDTMRLPAQFHMSTIEIRADRLRISDIVGRCIRREEELRESIDSLEQTVIVKTVFYIGGTDENARERLISEQADRMIFRKPDIDRTIPLKLERYKLVDGKREAWDEDDEPGVKIEYSGIAEMPFYLQDRDGYDFRILSREIVGTRVLYEVRLTPKSDFDIAPEGTIWIDASNFQILREEFDMGDRVPMPMFLKSVGPIIRERQRVDDVWVWKRMMVRVDVRTGLLRFVDRDIPEAVEFVVTFRDFRVNEPPVAEHAADRDALQQGDE